VVAGRAKRGRPSSFRSGHDRRRLIAALSDQLLRLCGFAARCAQQRQGRNRRDNRDGRRAKERGLVAVDELGDIPEPVSAVARGDRRHHGES